MKLGSDRAPLGPGHLPPWLASPHPPWGNPLWTLAWCYADTPPRVGRDPWAGFVPGCVAQDNVIASCSFPENVLIWK